MIRAAGRRGMMAGGLAPALLGPRADALRITEVWTDQAAHVASLDTIRGRSLIAGFDSHIELRPLGGV